MRKIIRLWFVFILLGEQFLFANFPSGGYELFCHDWIAVPGVANQVLAQTNTLLSYTLPLPPVIGQDHYAVLSWTPPAAPVAVPGGAIALPPLLLSAQATLALKRFLVGITNYRHNLDNFIHPQAIIHTALGLT